MDSAAHSDLATYLVNEPSYDVLQTLGRKAKDEEDDLGRNST